jgi:hypothetical protein
MKQVLLWSGEGDRARGVTWKGMPERVRAEIITQLVRLVIVSTVHKDEKVKVPEEPEEEKR